MRKPEPYDFEQRIVDLLGESGRFDKWTGTVRFHVDGNHIGASFFPDCKGFPRAIQFATAAHYVLLASDTKTMIQLHSPTADTLSRANVDKGHFGTHIKHSEETMKIDPQTVEQLHANSKRFVAAFNNNDAAAVAAVYAEDAVLATSRGPVYGRQAIEKWYADLFKAVHPKNYIEKRDPNSLRIIGTADNVASIGEWSDTLQGQNGEAIQAKGYWSVIETREGDVWKMCMLTWNEHNTSA